MTGTQPEPGAIPTALRPYVESMVGYRIAGAQPGTHIGMPSGSATLILSLDQPLDLIGADGRRGRFDTLLAGLHASPARILHDGSQHGVQLDLTPRGVAVLLGGPPGEVSGTSVDLGELIGPSARRLHERLGETPDWPARFALVLESLFAHREPRWQPCPEVDHAWQALTRSRGQAPIAGLAREVGWSTRHLGERFRQEFGHPPKTVARVLRFQESRRLVAAGAPPALAAARAGYADQSHQSRDWVDFAGTPPGRWLREDEIAFVQDRER
ncbi:helix-turn-helix domain-containing protein [Janibacter corallicola]|uniref:helix-turn-helix domain-containing protein n=1 Tax=Janibacter corallicola TaxID=415212 RepID=UPI00082A2CB4|nr:helix-turn-helix domain-containing protein [Janibacter corallicola]